MKALANAIRWDFVREARYNIIGIYGIITVLYLVLLLAIPMQPAAKDTLLIFLIFNDPVVLGFLFVGSLTLFERSDRTFFALAITPLEPAAYVWAKALTLTAIALVCSLAMAFAAHGWPSQVGYLLIGVALSSIAFTFLGYYAVAYCRSFNEYILRMAVLLMPVGLPFLNFFGWMDSFLLYLIPSQATLFLLEAAFYPVATWKIVYAVIYLIVFLLICFRLALIGFQVQVRNS